MRDVARYVGITERAVQRIVADLDAGGYLERVKSGRRNHYLIHDDLPLRHPIERNRRVSSLIALVHGGSDGAPPDARAGSQKSAATRSARGRRAPSRARVP